MNGFLVPVHDVTAGSNVILTLIEQPALRQRLGQMSRKRAVECFELSAIAGQTRASCLSVTGEDRLQGDER